MRCQSICPARERRGGSTLTLDRTSKRITFLFDTLLKTYPNKDTEAGVQVWSNHRHGLNAIAHQTGSVGVFPPQCISVLQQKAAQERELERVDIFSRTSIYTTRIYLIVFLFAGSEVRDGCAPSARVVRPGRSGERRERKR